MTAKLIDFPGRGSPVISDPDLAERARHGDQAAFSELVRRHQATVRGLLRRLTGGHAADADDLSQSAFLKAWTQIGTYSGGMFRSWLCTIAYREFLQSRRRANARQRIAKAVEVLTMDRVERPKSGTGRDLDRALAQLTEPQRIAVVLSVTGLSHSEVALATGWPLGTAKSHVSRGKEALRAQLIDYSVA